MTCDLHMLGLFCRLRAKSNEMATVYWLVSWVAKLRQKIVRWSKVDAGNSLMAIEIFGPLLFAF